MGIEHLFEIKEQRVLKNLFPILLEHTHKTITKGILAVDSVQNRLIKCHMIMWDQQIQNEGRYRKWSVTHKILDQGSMTPSQSSKMQKRISRSQQLTKTTWTRKKDKHTLGLLQQQVLLWCADLLNSGFPSELRQLQQ